jgi:TonB family protein
MSDAWRDWEGQVIDGAFTLRRHLGGSDHSVVFLTERQAGGQSQKAAIKFIQVEAAQADAQLSRWNQAAQLSHPNLLKLFETGRCQLAGLDLLYVVMECAEENLAQFLPQRALSPTEAYDMLVPFLDTLTYLHSNGLVHGHVKPSNILAIDDQLKLSSDSLSRVGDSRTAIGKPDAYTPPEAATEKLSPAADVWSLGVTLVESLTQHVPDGAAQPAKEDPRLSDSLPQPYSDIALNSIRRDPKRRWSVAQISNRLNPPAEPTPAMMTAATSAAAASAQLGAAETKSAAQAEATTETKAVPGTGPATASVAPTLTAPPDAPPPPKPPVFDPLSVPLSSVPPLGKKSTLQNQTIAGKSSSKSYYIFVAVLVALVLGAILGIPRLLDRGGQNDPSSDAASRPVNPAAPAASNPQSSSSTNQAGGNQAKSGKSTTSLADKQAQRSSEDSAQPFSSAGAEKSDTGKNRSTGAAEEAASLRSPFPHTARPAAAPFVPNRDASIAAGAVTPGEVLSQVLPEISDKSRSTIHGTVKVIVKVRVDTSGNVATAELAATGPSRFFADAALAAARRWDFAPAKVDGHVVPSEWLLHFNFTPTDTTVTPLPTKP